jgi:hypothetical protein
LLHSAVLGELAKGVGAVLLAVLGEVLGKAAGGVAEIDRDLDLAESAAEAGWEAARAGSGLKHDRNLAGSDIWDRYQPDFLRRVLAPHRNLFD